MQIYHLALASDWAEARRTGSYTVSTLGRSVEEVGFIHAARREQLKGVSDRFYRRVREPLVMVTIDTDRLASPWREDPVGEETYPHILGPLNTTAAVDVRAWSARRGRPMEFTEVFLGEMLVRVGLALLVMVATAVGVFAGEGVAGRPGGAGSLLGALAGLLVGVAVAVVIWRRRRS